MLYSKIMRFSIVLIMNLIWSVLLIILIKNHLGLEELSYIGWKASLVKLFIIYTIPIYIFYYFLNKLNVRALFKSVFIWTALFGCIFAIFISSHFKVIEYTDIDPSFAIRMEIYSAAQSFDFNNLQSSPSVEVKYIEPYTIIHSRDLDSYNFNKQTKEDWIYSNTYGYPYLSIYRRHTGSARPIVNTKNQLLNILFYSIIFLFPNLITILFYKKN